MRRGIQLTQQIESLKKVKAQFLKEGNELSAKRTQKEIDKKQRELDNLV
ncbi:hypothetical protein SEA_STIGMA_10 [Streptomyces phage Stigma]|nr:hypothetical protein SEA_STIGMA_10 [Streptomyces phage Stigma]